MTIKNALLITMLTGIFGNTVIIAEESKDLDSLKANSSCYPTIS